MSKWRCTVCGYIHLGPEPPAICPVCGAGREAFVNEGPAESTTGLAPEIWERVAPVLRQISYGLYIIGTRLGDRQNGMTANAFIQVAEDPLRVVLAVNKTRLTWEMLRASGRGAAALLEVESGYGLARHFGLQSGRSLDKFASVPHRPGANGCPIPADCLSFLEFSLLPGAELDAGSHTVFLAEVTNGGAIKAGAPLTYQRYQEIKRASPSPG